MKPKGAEIANDNSNPMVQMREMHCVECGRFLGYQAIVLGMVKIKCPNCKEWHTIDIMPQE